MTIQLREGTKTAPATASVRLAPNVDNSSLLGAGSTIGLTFEVYDATQTPRGPTTVIHTVTAEDHGFDRDVGGISLCQAMWDLCRKVALAAPNTMRCHLTEVSDEKVEFHIQPDGANDEGVEFERVALLDWHFTPISPPVVMVAAPGVNVLQDAGTQESPAVLMLSGTQWPAGSTISLRVDTNIADPTEFGIGVEAGDTAQTLANKIAAHVNSEATWRAETTGGLVILYAAAPASVISVKATAQLQSA